MEQSTLFHVAAHALPSGQILRPYAVASEYPELVRRAAEAIAAGQAAIQRLLEGEEWDRLVRQGNHRSEMVLLEAAFERARSQLRGQRGERRAERGMRRGGRFMRRAHNADAMRSGRMFGDCQLRTTHGDGQLLGECSGDLHSRVRQLLPCWVYARQLHRAGCFRKHWIVQLRCHGPRCYGAEHHLPGRRDASSHSWNVRQSSDLLARGV